MVHSLKQRLSGNAEFLIFSSLIVFVAIVLGLYVYDVGWQPDLEGMYAEFGVRMSSGHWPHVHFQDTSLGGLSLLNAALFAVGGKSLIVPRIFLLVAYTVGAISLLALFGRAINFLTGTLLSLACVVSGPAAFLIPGPEWYVVSLGMISCLTLTLFFDQKRGFWLVATGALSSVGFLLSPTCGSVLVVAVMFSLVLLPSEERAVPVEPKDADMSGDGDSPPSRILAVKYLALSASLVGVGLVVWQQRNISSLAYLLVGPATLVVLLLYSEWTSPSDRLQFQTRCRFLGHYLTTVVAIVLPFFLILILKGGTNAIVEALNISLLQPLMQIGQVGMDVMRPSYIGGVLGVCLVVGLFVKSLNSPVPKWGVWFLATIIVCAVVCMIVPMSDQLNYKWAWSVLELMVPVAIIFGALVLTTTSWRNLIPWNDRQRSVAMVFLIMLTCFNFLRLPDNSHVSFLYVFPFLLGFTAIVLGPHIVSSSKIGSQISAGVLYSWLVCVTIFSWTYLIRSEPAFFGNSWVPIPLSDQMRIERAPIYMSREHIRAYENMARVITMCTEEDDYILAFPNSHISYFLTGRRNPFFTYGMPRLKGSDSLTEAIRSAIDTKGANARVLIYNRHKDQQQEFYGTQELKREIESIMPVRVDYGPFTTYSPRIEWLFFVKNQGNPAKPSRPRYVKTFPWGKAVVNDWNNFQTRYAEKITREQQLESQMESNQTTTPNVDLPSTDANGDGGTSPSTSDATSEP